MNLHEDISRIKEVMGLNESKEKVIDGIEELLNSKLYNIKTHALESFDLSDIDILNQIDSLEKIKVIDFEKNRKISDDKSVPSIRVDLYVNSGMQWYADVIGELQHSIRPFIPNALIFVRDIIDIRDFGPGIDW
jgi:hypothetical protein